VRLAWERPAEDVLPEASGNRQLQAIGRPRLLGDPNCQLLDGTEALVRGVLLGDDEDEVLGANRYSAKRPSRRRRARDREVQLATVQQGEQFVVVAEGGHDGYLLSYEPGDDFGREELGARADANRGFESVCLVSVDASQQRLENVERLGDRCVEVAPSARGFDAARLSDEQRGPDRALQGGKVLAHRGLADASVVGGVGDRPGPVNGKKAP